MVPDYARFIPEAIDIIKQAEDWALLDLILDMTSPLRERHFLDLKEFNVAKLVWRACEELPDPLYAVFKKLTEMPDLVDRRRRFRVASK